MLVQLRWFVFIFVFSLVSCSNKNEVKKEEPQVLPKLSGIVGGTARINHYTAFTSIDDELSLLYSDKNNIVFQRGTVKTIVEENKGKTHRFWLYYDKKHLYALWWRKFTGSKGKTLFFSVSNDQGVTFSTPKILNSGNGILPTVSIASDGNGKVVVVYHDERNLHYEIYTNISHDAGKTWLLQDMRIDETPKISPLVVDPIKISKNVSDAISPFVYLVEDKAVVVWQQLSRTVSSSTFGFYSRSYDFATKKWSGLHAIFESDDLSTAEYFVSQYQNVILVLAEVRGRGVLAFLSKNAGESWKALGANYSKGKLPENTGVSFLSAVVGSDNKFHVITTLEQPDKRTKIDISTVSIEKAEWDGAPREFDRGKNHQLTHSNNPQMGQLDNGNIVAVWDDYRHILSSVYMSVSNNAGNNWIDPKPLTVPSYNNVELLKLVTGQKKAWVIAGVTTSTGKSMEEYLVYEELSEANNGDIVGNNQFNSIYPAKDKAKQRLEERVASFWKLRKKGKWESTWEYFDPLYRMKFGKYGWLKTQGRLKFGEYISEDVSYISQEFAISKGVVKIALSEGAEFKGGDALGDLTSFKNKEIETEWGWFYDDWYIIPESFFMDVHKYK